MDKRRRERGKKGEKKIPRFVKNILPKMELGDKRECLYCQTWKKESRVCAVVHGRGGRKRRRG